MKRQIHLLQVYLPLLLTVLGRILRRSGYLLFTNEKSKITARSKIKNQTARRWLRADAVPDVAAGRRHPDCRRQQGTVGRSKSEEYGSSVDSHRLLGRAKIQQAKIRRWHEFHEIGAVQFYSIQCLFRRV